MNKDCREHANHQNTLDHFTTCWKRNAHGQERTGNINRLTDTHFIATKAWLKINGIMAIHFAQETH